MPEGLKGGGESLVLIVTLSTILIIMRVLYYLFHYVLF